MYKSPYEQYKKQSVSFATPGKLIVLLYDAALKNIRLADLAIEEHNVAQAHEKLVNCQDIIQELMFGLDFQYPISYNLMALYEYIKGSLVDANIKKDRTILQDLIPLLTELRDTWEEAEKQARIQNPILVKNA